MRPPLALLLFLVACNTDVSVSKIATDADHDGYDESVDCDDAHATVNPDAPESCDGLDNDCDGTVDDDPEDATTWYADGDGDDWGDEEQTSKACEAPDGYVGTAGDCDDEDAAVHPDATEDDCEDPTDYNCDGSSARTDADGDGWAACQDCDDSDAARSPDAVEVCDDADVDEDCDDLSDDADDDVDAATFASWSRDVDGDGFGADPTTEACDQPEGFAAEAGDCDDLDGEIHPGAMERCDPEDADEDCDDVSDDADASTDPSTWTTFYLDDDGDAYGDPARSLSVCDAPEGYVLDATDCDDANAEISPGADELCDASDVDEDCDGAADDDDASATPLVTWYRDGDGDGYGDPASTLERCDVPAGYGSDDLDCDDGDATINPAATEICENDADDDCDGSDDACPRTPLDGDYSLGDTYARIYGVNADDESSAFVATGADFNRDGSKDLLIGSCRSDDATTNAGQVYVALGPFSGDSSLGDATTSFLGEAANDDMCRVAVGGDYTGDGQADIVTSAYTYGTYSNGRVYLLEMEGSGSSDVADVAFTIFEAEGTYSLAGHAMANAGDVNGDGAEELLVAASGKNRTYLLEGSFSSGTVSLATADAFIDGDSLSLSGYAVAGAGDTNADGLSDVLSGGPGRDPSGLNAGAAYVLEGPLSGSYTLSTDVDATLLGETKDDYAGITVAYADVNADGYDDVFVGSISSSGDTFAGKAYLCLGPLSGSSSLGDADIALVGESARDNASRSIANAGDVDGDGGDDLLVGTNALTGSGRAYLVYTGGLTGSLDLGDADVVFSGEATGDYAGSFVGGGTDLDGDDVPDLVIGALLADTTLTDVGVTYVVPGSL